VAVNEQLAASLSTLVGAIATAILMAASYYWGPRKRDERREQRQVRDDASDSYYRDGGNRRRRQIGRDGPERRRDSPSDYNGDDAGYEEA
jgi:hypothetical protein